MVNTQGISGNAASINGGHMTQLSTTNRVRNLHFEAASLTATYIDGTISNVPVIILIDTGCSICILPSRLSNGLPVISGHTKLLAVNGTVEANFHIHGQNFIQTFVASGEVDDVILGLSFLTQRDISQTFNTNCIAINGVTHQLRHMPTRQYCRRVIVHDSVSIPPRSQVAIQATAPLRSWTKPHEVCLLETSKPTGGLYIARSVIPSRQAHCPITVCNVRDSELTLPQGTVIGTTDATIPCEDTCLSHIDDIRLSEVKPIIDNILNSVPDELTVEQKQKLSHILWSNQICLSTDSTYELDVGFTDVLEHTINTGSTPPVRETLRRRPVHYQRQIDEQVQSMLDAGVIRPSTSPWSSNVCLIREKDDSLRFAIDKTETIKVVRSTPSTPLLLISCPE
jgi:hypothetical protein